MDKVVFVGTAFVVCMVIVSYGVLSAADDLRLFFPELLACSAVIMACVSVLLLVPCPAGSRRRVSVLILLLAALFRVLFVEAPAQLSDDVYRYLWDGLQLLHGHNPYAQAPQQVVATSTQLIALQGLINHPQFVTIYPPAAQLFFALAGGQLLQFKLLCSLVDLGSCVLLARLLRRLNRSPWWLTVYAWHPLVVLECAGSGHIDILAVFFVLAALTIALSSGRYSGWSSGLLVMLAVLTKVFPVIFAPFVWLMLPVNQRRAFVFGAVITAVILLGAFSPALVNGLETLGTYSRHWEFSGFTFQQLRHWLHSGDQARLLLATLFALILLSAWLRLKKSQRPEVLPMLRTLTGVVLVFLLLTPTLHPWYALYLVAFAALVPHPAALVLSWSVLLSYQVVAHYHLTGVWLERADLSFYIWLAPLLALLASALFSRFNRRSNS